MRMLQRCSENEEINELELYILPAVIINVDMKTPITPNSTIVKKLWKNCFFFTWNLAGPIVNIEKKNYS